MSEHECACRYSSYQHAFLKKNQKVDYLINFVAKQKLLHVIFSFLCKNIKASNRQKLKNMESFFPNKTQDDRNVDTALTIMKKNQKVDLISKYFNH